MDESDQQPQELLKIYRRRRDALERQIAVLGPHAPSYMLIELEDVGRSIHQLETELDIADEDTHSIVDWENYQSPVITTSLANTSRWLGGVGAAATALATLTVFIARLNTDIAILAGFGFFIGFPGVTAGVVGVIFGVIALTRVETVMSRDGRRHATIGVIAGLSALLLCCVATALVPNTATQRP